MKEKARFRRILVLCVGALYLLVVVGATVYSQTGYVQRLPVVTLAPIDGVVVPNESLVKSPDGGLLLNYVEQENGPWGKRYVLRQWKVSGHRPEDENHTIVYDIENLLAPVAVAISDPNYYDGMEVRLEKAPASPGQSVSQSSQP